MQDLKTVIFIGRSGCGKGTQAKRLMEFLSLNHPIKEILYISTGELLRKLWEGESYAANLSKEWNIDGDLQPAFVPIYAWSKYLIENTEGKEHWIFDGTPRRLNESQVLGSALKFFARKNPTIVFLNVSEQWAIDRLRERGRYDDLQPGDVAKRFAWYERDTVPVIESLCCRNDFTLAEINGEQTIDQVHEAVKKALAL